MAFPDVALFFNDDVPETSLAIGSDGRWQRCNAQLASIEALRNNWDGAGARAIDPSIVSTAIFAIKELQKNDGPPPSRIVASPDGSVVFEWQDEPGLFVEAEIEEPYVVEWMMQEGSKPFEHWTESLRHPEGRARPDWFLQEFFILEP